jgi:hypothetical protein
MFTSRKRSYVPKSWSISAILNLYPGAGSNSQTSSQTNTSPCSTGFSVPGSTFRYGSALIMSTLRPRICRIFPI